MAEHQPKSSLDYSEDGESKAYDKILPSEAIEVKKSNAAETIIDHNADNVRVQSVNMGIAELDRYVSCAYPFPNGNGEWCWTYLRQGMFTEDVLFRISVSRERIVVCQSADDYPSNQLTIQSSPLRYFQNISLKRQRLLPFKGYSEYLIYLAKGIFKRMGSVGFNAMLLLSSIIFIIIWCIPITLDDYGNTSAATAPAVRWAFAFIAFQLLFAGGTVYYFLSEIKNAILTLGTMGLFVFNLLLFAILASLTDKTHGEYHGLLYGDKLSCSCSKQDAVHGYDFSCYSDVCNMDDADCGFCGNEFYGPYITALILICLIILAIIALKCFSVCSEKSSRKKLKVKKYTVCMTIHGSSDYGYPLELYLDLEQSLQVQDKIYELIKDDPHVVSQTSKMLNSSNAVSMVRAFTGGVCENVSNFFLELISQYL